MNSFKTACFVCVFLVAQICVNGQAIGIADASASAQSYVSSATGGLAAGQFVIPAVIKPILQEPCYEQSVSYAPAPSPSFGAFLPPPPMYPPMILGGNNNRNNDFDELLYLLIFASLGRGGNGGGYGGGYGGGSCGGGSCGGSCGGYNSGCGYNNGCNGCGGGNYCSGNCGGSNYSNGNCGGSNYCGGNCGGGSNGCGCSNSYTTCSVPFSLSGSTVDSCTGDVYTFVPSSSTSTSTSTGSSSSCPPSIQIVLSDSSGTQGQGN